MVHNHYSMSTNPELDLAYDFVSSTNRNLYLTGKAGTGKTTFLHRVRAEVAKRMVVAAPTGVAAINAKGVTIHSQFQLPFGVLTPDRLQAELRTHRLSRQKAEVIRSLDLLIIDEISMVRADVLDALGAVLRRYRRTEQPFGGVQLLMIGDLHQLPPVVRDNEWEQLRDHYPSAYFFASQELRRAGLRTIALQHIYRQSDAAFIGLLNQVRDNCLDPTGLELLNSRYRGPDYCPPDGADYITLSSHNRTADALNAAQLATLTTPLHTFEAVVSGKFPPSMYPNDSTLQFRVGAQVMFNKNDTVEQLYYNGKIGRITAIEADRILVTCPGEPPIEVLPVQWENRKYELDENKEVTDEMIGTYEQHPLRLAWAITIHKSQGLTFERVIIDAGAAFAHGQVYVALSRCKSFEGIVLRSRISDQSVRTDRVVKDHASRAEAEAPTPADLRQDRRRYQIDCLKELFDFASMEQTMARLQRSLREHEAAIQGEAQTQLAELRTLLSEKVTTVCHRFARQLPRYARAEELPTEHTELRDRLIKASTYLLPYLERLYAGLGALSFMSDNQQVYRTVSDRLKEVGLRCLTKLRVVATLKDGFDPDRYVRARANAGLEFEQTRKRPPVAPTAAAAVTSASTLQPELYAQLATWRTERATAAGLPPYRILHNSVLLGIASALPTTSWELKAVAGVGKKTFESYGEELLSLVADYQEVSTPSTQ